MGFAETMLPEFDREMSNTRKVLERVPDDKLTWKPHEKSGSAGWLATHISVIPVWGKFTIEREFFDLAQEKPLSDVLQSSAAIVDQFDRNVAACRAALSSVSDERLRGNWTLRRGVQVFFTQPRATLLRAFVMNHLIHHRAQLAVYLRLLDVPVPALYGPSADEQ